MAGKNDKKKTDGLELVELKIPRELGEFVDLVSDLAGATPDVVVGVLLASWVIKDRQKTALEIQARLDREEENRNAPHRTPVAAGGIARTEAKPTKRTTTRAKR